MSEKKSCFVVTPIGDENTAIRRHIDGIIDQAIIPAIGDEFEIKVSHREYEIGSINDRVIQNVYDSDLVVANLTGLNPNVMFEIAIRYSFGKPAIVIAEKGTKLPFDIVDENTIFYINDPAGAAELKDNIKRFVQRIDWIKCEYGPVFSAIKNAAVINHIESGISDTDNKNAFSFLVEKISDLEAEIKGMKADEYTKKYIYNKTKLDIISGEMDSMIDALERKSGKVSKEALKTAIEKYILNYCDRFEIEDINIMKGILRILMGKRDSISNESKELILEVISDL